MVVVVVVVVVVAAAAAAAATLLTILPSNAPHYQKSVLKLDLCLLGVLGH